jgi:dTDP-4-dehydrorhamnose 3,5-epimerase
MAAERHTALQVRELGLPGLLLIEPPIFRDNRGYFYELYTEHSYAPHGVARSFVQDNISVSRRNTIRGLHFQEPTPQGKLVAVLRGVIWDVAVDVRCGSPSFGRHSAIELDDRKHRQLWIPRGFAHGFAVLSDEAEVLYKCDSFYEPTHERSLHWADPALAIDWPIEDPILSERDRAAPLLRDASVLPVWQP